MPEDKMFKFNYIMESYKNTENAIRFADTKAAAVVAVHALMLRIIIETLIAMTIFLINQPEPAKLAPSMFYGVILFKMAVTICIGLYIFFILKSLTGVFSTVVPRFGRISKSFKTLNIFWCSDLKEKIDSHGLDNIKENFEQIDSESLIGDILYEQAKVSSIAGQKMKNVEKAIIHTKCAFYFWAIILAIGIVIRAFQG